MNKTSFTILDDKKTLVMERTFTVTKDRLWNAYASAEMLAQWFSPEGWATDVKEHSFVDGGEYRYVMKCVDEAQKEWFGQTSSGKMVFGGINPKSSFGYTDYFTDENGVINEALPASHSSVELIQQDDNTTTLKVTTNYDTEAALKQVLEMGMEEGYSQTLDKLEELLAENN